MTLIKPLAWGIFWLLCQAIQPVYAMFNGQNAVTPHFEFYVDPSGKQTIGTVSKLPDTAFKPAPKAGYVGGYDYSVHWLRFSLPPSDTPGEPLWLRIKPAYTSKWNPIEHRVFPHITRALQGVVLTSLQLANELIAKASTTAGLKVVACIFDKVYATGRKVAAGFKESMRIPKQLRPDGFLISQAHSPTWVR